MTEHNKQPAVGISLRGIEELIHSEGLKLCPYLDSVKIPTIGIGSTFYEDGKKVTMKDKCLTNEQAMSLAMYTINKIFLPGVVKLLKVPQNQNQVDALINLAYNIGVGALTTSTLMKKINAKGTKEEISAAWRMWNKAGGKVIQGLTNRREREINMYFA